MSKNPNIKQIIMKIISELISLSAAISYFLPCISLEVGKYNKRHSNHKLPLCIPEKIKHYYGNIYYEAFKCCGLNVRWLFGIQLIGRGGRESKNILGMINLPLRGFKETFTKIEAHTGIAEQLMRDL